MTLDSKLNALFVFGTRPEAIKMAPVIQALNDDEAFNVQVAVTGQHREMLDQVLKAFNIPVDYDLKLMRHGQTPQQIVTGVLDGMGPIIEEARPGLILVHGDTITTFAAALSAFFAKVPVAHVEAGLRTQNPYDPFPEEMDRRLTGVLAEVHLAPTHWAKDNLLKENVSPDSVYVTGNTVIDALLETVRPDYQFQDPQIAQAVESGRRLIVVTTHRRENWGEPMRRIYQAILEIVGSFSDVHVVFAMHKNPVVRDVAKEMLGSTPRISLIEPPDYVEFIHLMQASTLIASDSGGLQEEAPALNKPVLVLRETTERPEGVEAGTSLQVGTKTADIVAAATRLLKDESAYRQMAQAKNPYGDGQASKRIRQALAHWMGLGPRPADYAH